MDMKLEDMTPSQLRAYADEKERQEKIKSVPAPKDIIDYEDVVKLTKDYLESFVDGENYIDPDDFPTYLFEEVMRSIYGEDVFNWINEQTCTHDQHRRI